MGETEMSVYEIITDKIIGMLEKGTVPWRKPWTEASWPRNLESGKAYRGINVFLLATEGMPSPWWLTRNQVDKFGGEIKESEKFNGTVITYFRMIENKKRKTPSDPKEIPLLRYYRVWNLSQTTGVRIPKGRDVTDLVELSEEDINANAEAIIKGWKDGPKVRHDSKDGAYWTPVTDTIHLPKRATFASASGYYASRFHEMGHATGHATRLDRHTASDQFRFGSHSYGREELVAEMTAAFLCGHAGILQDTEENNAAYLSSWLKVIREDSRAVVKAASAAQVAAELILGVSKETAEVTA